MKFYKVKSVNPIARDLANNILKHLEKNEKVLWLSGGGSCIRVAVAISQILKNKSPLTNLTITLTDERYGQIGHANSNWRQLLDAGFSLPGATLRPILNGENIGETTRWFDTGLQEELTSAQYKIGLFGMGTDGHTAGILPSTSAIDSDDYADFYKGPDFNRITMTFKAITMLDEAFLYAIGESKKGAINKLKQEVTLSEQPAQILKRINKFSIYNDYEGENL